MLPGWLDACQSLSSTPCSRVVDAVSSARSAVRAAAAVPTDSLSVDELTDAIARVAALEAQAGALRLSLLAEADRRQVAQSLGATGTDAWAARLTGANRAEMANVVRLARLLRERYDATREAFAAGAINQAQVSVIVRPAELLPAEVTDAHRRAAEAGLVTKAVHGMNAKRLRQAGRRMLEGVARELADRHEAEVLADEERGAEVETWLTLADNGNGTFSGRFVIPELHGHLLRAALEALTSPAQLSRNRAGDVVRDDAVADLPGRNGTEKLGHGFLELIEHLPDQQRRGRRRLHPQRADPAGAPRPRAPPRRAGLGPARHRCPRLRRRGPAAGLQRRVCCRWSSAARRRSSTSAANGDCTPPRSAGPCRCGHETCAAEGCERPFAWCDVHHPHAWSRGGPTDLDNAVPLCGFHHRRAHDPRFDLTRLPSGEVRYHRRR